MAITEACFLTKMLKMPKKHEKGGIMDLNQFKSYIRQSEFLSDPDYRRGYCYGLRRFYHGETFGDNIIIATMKERGGLLKEGIINGLTGRGPANK